MECTQTGLDGQSAANRVAEERDHVIDIATTLPQALVVVIARGMVTPEKKKIVILKHAKVTLQHVRNFISHACYAINIWRGFATEQGSIYLIYEYELCKTEFSPRCP